MLKKLDAVIVTNDILGVKIAWELISIATKTSMKHHVIEQSKQESGLNTKVPFRSWWKHIERVISDKKWFMYSIFIAQKIS